MIKDIQELAKQRKQKDRAYIEGVRAEIGKLESNGSYTVRVPNTKDEVYVRLNGDPAQTVAAINHETDYKARLTVRVFLNENKRWQVLRVDPLQGGIMMGEAVGAANTPPLAGSAVNIVLPQDKFEPGRIRPTGNTFELYMEEMPYGDVRLGKVTVNITSEAALVAAGKKAVIVISVDPTTNTLNASKGDDVGIPITLTLDDALAVTIPAGDIRLWAYIIQVSATDLPTRPAANDATYYFDLRTFVNSGSEASGTMHDFSITADTGSPETVEDAETVDFVGDVGISTEVANPRSILISMDINKLDPAPAIDGAADYIPMYDASTGDVVKIPPNDLVTGGGGGNLITAGEYGDSRPSSPVAGDLFLISDGYWDEIYTGGAWIPHLAGRRLYNPSLQTFSWVNQGGASVDNTKGAIYLEAPAGAGVNLRIRTKSAPSTPYTITAKVEPTTALAVQNHTYGIGFRQSSDGKLAVLMIQHSSGTAAIFSAKYTNATTFSATYVSPNVIDIPRWLRITDDGTDRKVYFSSDGLHYTQLHTVGRTDFLTADEICFFANSQNATYPIGITVVSWEEA